MAGVVLPALLAGLTMLLVIYNRPGFTGERIKNPDSYSLDILRMNGTDSHTLSLNAGDVLQVEFETSKGSLHIKITAPDGTIIYAGNGEETTSFDQYPGNRPLHRCRAGAACRRENPHSAQSIVIQGCMSL